MFRSYRFSGKVLSQEGALSILDNANVHMTSNNNDNNVKVKFNSKSSDTTILTVPREEVDNTFLLEKKEKKKVQKYKFRKI